MTDADAAEDKSEGLPVTDGFNIGDHLDALRLAVLRSVLLPILVLLVVWPFWDVVNEWLKVLALGHLPVSERPQFVSLDATETMFVSLELSFRIALVSSIPWILMNVWWFVSPGLYPHERRFGRILIPGIVALFGAGVAFALFVAIPFGMSELLHFGFGAVDQQLMSIQRFYDFIFMITTVLGVCFLTPVVVAPAVRFGLLKAEMITKHRRLLIFFCGVLGAILTPTADPITMSLVAVPLYFLIEGGVIIGRIWRRRAEARAVTLEQIKEAFEAGAGTGGSNAGEPQSRSEAVERAVKGDGLLGRGAADSVASLIRDAGASLARNLEEGAQAVSSEGIAKDDTKAAPQATRRDPAREPLPSVKSLTKTAPIIRPAQGAVAQGTASAIEQATAQTARVTKASDESATGAVPSGRVPSLPRELRRRIDHYIRLRLNEVLVDVLRERQSGDHEGENPDGRP